MPVIATHELRPGPIASSLQIYGGLDACVTLEVHSALQRLSNREPEIYSFERALQAPALDMMLRGFLVDEPERQGAIRGLITKLDRLNSILDLYARAVWDKPLNPRSQKQLIDFFYGRMQLPEHWTSKKGVRKLSMDRETLEKLQDYFYAAPIIAAILEFRDLSKQLEVLQTEVDADGRMRTSYNIAGTETGRWSSSSNAFGAGTNLQNISDKNRRILIADPGMKLCGIDLEQAESREVGWKIFQLFGDSLYLDACIEGDLHTTTCKLIWPHLGWTGDPKADRAIAERPFYRDFSYRDMSKRGGHGSNYFGTPWTMAKHLKVPVQVMKDFQAAYFGAYPGIPKWHRWIAEQLQTTQRIENAFGVERHFFGRPNDDTTLREAIAHGPQSSTAQRLNLALWRVWRHMPEGQLLAQVHDALYFQFPECSASAEAALISKALGLLSTPLHHAGRVFDVPGEAKVGWNWARFDPKLNPAGLAKLVGKDTRKRPSRTSILDRVL